MNNSNLQSLAKLEVLTDGQLRLSGTVNFRTVPGLVVDSQNLFKNANGLEVDLADVNRADSAGVALLIEWTRRAQKVNEPIRFINIPSQMLAIARLSGVDEMLSLQE